MSTSYLHKPVETGMYGLECAMQGTLAMSALHIASLFSVCRGNDKENKAAPKKQRRGAPVKVAARGQEQNAGKLVSALPPGLLFHVRVILHRLHAC